MTQASTAPPPYHDRVILQFSVMTVVWGIVGMTVGVLLAAPLTVVVFVFVQRIYVRTMLGKPIEVAGSD